VAGAALSRRAAARGNLVSVLFPTVDTGLAKNGYLREYLKGALVAMLVRSAPS